MEKLREGRLITFVVVSDAFRLSGPALMAASIVHERDPALLAAPARGRTRSKGAGLTGALTGRFTEHHHALLLTQALQQTDAVIADIAAGRRADDPCRERHRNEPVPHPGAPELMGASHPESASPPAASS